jgi:glyceraldehyde 3-phosphate dehydrogenase
MNKKTRVGINGFGRIGRAFLKVAMEYPDELEVVAVNDLGDIDNMAYLLKYDSSYGKSNFDIKTVRGDAGGGESAGATGTAGTVGESAFIINGKKVLYLAVKDPATLPWKALDVDVVVESTGLFVSAEKAIAHVTGGGAKRVVVSAPVKDAADAKVKGVTVLMGINESALGANQVSSNASCTTNAASPLISILHEKIGIEKAILNTVHAYTASQSIVDGPAKKDWREGRAAAMNIVPSTTGAAIAVTAVLTELKGKFDGISLRVPVVTGSIADVTFIAKRSTSVDEVNTILKAAATDPRWKGIFTVTNEELVSRDIVGNPHASIADLKFTKVVDGNLVKVMAWYDNEMGYTHTLVRHVIAAGKLLN